MRYAPVTRLAVGLVLPDGERRVGELLWAERRIFFEFDPTFIASPLPISPQHLPVRAGAIEEPKRTFDGLFGVFDDSLPDGWGRLLLDRAMARHGLDRRRLTPLDRLAAVGVEGAGALVYRPVWEVGARPSVVDLGRLAEEAQRVLEGEDEAVLAELLALGGSSGGARPKVLLGWAPETGMLLAGQAVLPDGYVPVLVKFPMQRDRPDVGAVEESYARTARRAGLRVMPTWLIEAGRGHPGFFATQRFDRPRIHTHSLCGLLHADHRVPCMDYEDLLRAVRWLTRDQGAVEEMFRRMVFNVLAWNRDDHSRNTAFQMDERGVWRLTPAYDLTFSSGPGGEHWMTVRGEGRSPGRAHLFEVGRRVGVPKEHAAKIFEEVSEAVAGWDAIAQEAGVSRESRQEIGPRLRAARG